ncbi:MAG: hypothetical protein L6244_00685 [Candidatus Methanoperedenaceae archaeon]|nr:hypothetical protein [Candidatus Methanoperedenaceae archaeon]
MNKGISMRHYGKRQSLIILLAFVFCVLATIFTLSQSFADDKVRMIEGLIEDVTPNSIRVRGAYYDITGAPLLNASDKIVARNELKAGKRVGIFFKNNRITSILIYEDMVE